MQSSHIFIDYRTYINHWHHSRTHFKIRELTTFAQSSYRWFDALWSQFFHMFLTISPSFPFEIRQVCSAKCTNKSALSHRSDRWSLACSILELELFEGRSWSVPAFFPFFTHTMAEYFAWEDRNLLVLCMRLDPYVSICRLVGGLIDWSIGWLVGWSVSNAFIPQRFPSGYSISAPSQSHATNFAVYPASLLLNFCPNAPIFFLSFLINT